MRRRRQLYPVKLRQNERKALEAMNQKGSNKVRVYKRSRVLLLADEGKSDQEIMAAVGISNPTIKRIRKAYAEQGLQSALEDAPRSGRPSIFDGQTRAKITALACTQAPEGYAKWSLRLLADKAVELKLVDEISHTQVAKLLKKRAETPPETTMVHS